MCYAKVTMGSKPPNSWSSLNPNAPVFVPAAFLAAEDFSPEWWRLIQSSTSFREWWMKERYEADEAEQAAAAASARERTEFDDIDDLLELGFQTGILDDLDEQPAFAAPPQHQYQQHLQPPQQHQQQKQLQNEPVHLVISSSFGHQKLGSPEPAGGAGFQNGNVLKEGKPQ